VVTWELLTGRQLFAVQDVDETLSRVSEMTIPDVREVRADIPEALALILAKALERDLSKRYQSAGHLALDLEQYMYGDRFGPTLVTLETYLARLFGREATGSLDTQRS
jgi:serine/threonine-protein kinase